MLSKKLLGAAAAAEPVYIEDVFSTYLWQGTGSAQTITNGVDLAGEGGLVWIKGRAGTYGVDNHIWTDTVRGYNKNLYSNLDIAQTTSTNRVTTFNADGFSLGTENSVNNSSTTYASWTFRKAEKFFDVVTYTGSNSNQTINHNLGSAPGCIIIKKLDSNTFNAGWAVYHRSLTNPNNYYLRLDTTAAQTDYGAAFISSVNSSSFSVAGGSGFISIAGSTYVAYLFAHDAGGFGDSGSESVISCGSFTTDGSGAATVSLGYEPQWIMIKSTGSSGWSMWDTMRGLPVGGADAYLFANSSAAEATFNNVDINATGFNAVGWGSSSTYIYIAIRRGPMKTPTTGTSVFTPNAYAGGTAGISFNLGFAPDALLTMRRNTSNFDILQSRLIGQNYLFTNTTDSELGGQSGIPAWDANTGTTQLTTATAVTGWNGSGSTYVNEAFRRAPGFFDVVCYTGNGTSSQSITHNLGVTPELFFVKRRSGAGAWEGYSATLGSNASIRLNESTAAYTGDSLYWNNTAPTSTTFNVGTYGTVNASGGTYVAYLFATVPGVSKVGSYTGNGSSQTINMGFSTGARFFLVKRTDSTGDWWVYDSARGIVSAADPALRLNSTAAEVTSADAVDTDSSGLIVNQESTCNINVNSATYIYLGIA